ncbi:hypothetical protein DXG01_005217 [Tephrocybe rancida]|nr:hypothetical protein DXG01_005217 [Tephrocybe rancida]
MSSTSVSCSLSIFRQRELTGTTVQPNPTRNIVIFGETGSGKSSIINMIAQNANLAYTGSSVRGVTLSNTRYEVDIEGITYNVYDTAGLDEAKTGSVSKQQAITQLYSLLKSLDTGVNLLIFCYRAPRIRDTTHKNWRLFYEIICLRQVPIVLAITGLEQEENMDDWWIRNKGAFQEYEIHPNGIACITATRGRQRRSGGYQLDEEYEESKSKMWKQIGVHCLVTPWRVAPVEWLKKIILVSYESRWYDPCGIFDPIKHETTKEVISQGVQELVRRCEMSEEDATVLGKALSEV